MIHRAFPRAINPTESISARRILACHDSLCRLNHADLEQLKRWGSEHAGHNGSQPGFGSCVGHTPRGVSMVSVAPKQKGLDLTVKSKAKVSVLVLAVAVGPNLAVRCGVVRPM